MKRLIPFLLVLSMLFTFTPVAYAAVTPNTLNDNISGIYKQLAVAGIPVGKNSKVFFVDTVNGYDTNNGLSTDKPLKSVAAAEDKTVANRNDVVAMIGCATADAITTAITWDKSYTHLVGLSADLPGVGQRCRITNGGTATFPTLITISGNGCIFKNIQFWNGNSHASDSGAAIVTGSRCYFENVFFAGMGSSVAAARAGSYSLALSGAECTFKDCTIGLATQARAAANAELILSGECNREKFIGCEFVSWSVDTTKRLVSLTATAVPYTLIFESCAFSNLNSNNGAVGNLLAYAIADAATPHHWIEIRKSALFTGCTKVSDAPTKVLHSLPATNAAAGLGAVFTT